MKIDVVVFSLRGGGAERVAANLASGLANLGHAVRLLSYEPVEAAEYRPTAAVEVDSLARTGGPAWGSRLVKPLAIAGRLAALRRLILSRRPDVVLGIQANVAIEVGLACQGTGLKVIGCEHNNPQRSVRGRFWQAVRPFVYPRLSAVTVLSEGAASELRAVCPSTRIEIIPNAVPWPLQERPPFVDPDDVVRPGRKVVLGAGRLAAAKGFDELVQAFAGIASRLADADLVLAGEGPLRASLEALARANGLQGRVHLPGRIGNMPDWYRRADLFVMTSHWEGQPMVMLEAMAHGTPVVAYDFRYGPRDIIRPGVDGEIVPDRDRDLLVDRVAYLLADEARRATMATAAASIRLRFGEEPVLERWNTLLKDVAGR